MPGGENVAMQNIEPEVVVENLTPHEVTIVGGRSVTTGPSVARVLAPKIHRTVSYLDGLPVVEDDLQIVGLPEPRDGRYYIVSTKVVTAAHKVGRTTSDLLTTEQIIRDVQGRVAACGYLRRN